MILCIGTTPAAQRVMVFSKLTLDAVNRAVTTFDGAAGKSVNVARVLKSLGERSAAVGFVGGERGHTVRAALHAEGIELEFVTVHPPTRQCITVIDQSAGTHTELVEESKAVTAGDYDSLRAIIKRRVCGARAVVMSGTLTPGGPVDFYYQCTHWAHEAGALPIVDGQGLALLEALKAAPALVKPNRAELAATVGQKIDDETSLKPAMRMLCERGAGSVVVTAGKNPAVAFDGRSFWRIQSPKIQAVNPIGSGDSFTAGLTVSLLRGDDLGEACRWGAAAGAANALTLAAGEVHRQDVERLVKEVSVEQMSAE